MSLPLFPAAQMTAAESSLEATMLAAWLAVGAISLAIGLVLVVRANRRFTQQQARGFVETGVETGTRGIDVSYTSAAA